ncbi:MAG: N,N-dimethylformamidase beta subunit family domain-containing protein, partial [Tistlia sp.]
MTGASTKARLPITGYLDRLSARPGERLAVKVSAEEAGDYEASVLRIRCADPNPAGPGLRYEPQDFGLGGRYPARRQAIDRGSYASIPADRAFAAPRLAIAARVQPWLLRKEPSTLFACRDAAGRGWSLSLTETGLDLEHDGGGGTPSRLALPIRMRRRHWYRVWAGFDLDRGQLLVGCQPLDGESPVEARSAATLEALADAGALTLAASLDAEGLSFAHFNGRLEDVALFGALPEPGAAPPEPSDRPGPGLIAWWDFSQGIESQAILDRGAKGLNGRLVNVPTRAVCGSRWSGRAMSWREAPRDYAAIHFHEDDLYDCGWDSDFEILVPEGMRSGVYGLRLSQGGHSDILPFYVLPPKGRPTAKVCFLAPTFTYQAYANHARGNCDAAMRGRIAEWGATPYNPDDFPVYGPSTYNFHPDGTGTAFSSRLRPTLTVRP